MNARSHPPHPLDPAVRVVLRRDFRLNLVSSDDPDDLTLGTLDEYRRFVAAIRASLPPVRDALTGEDACDGGVPVSRPGLHGSVDASSVPDGGSQR